MFVSVGLHNHEFVAQTMERLIAEITNNYKNDYFVNSRFANDMYL